MTLRRSLSLTSALYFPEVKTAHRSKPHPSPSSSHNIERVSYILDIAHDSTRIARESILWGIGLSIVGMGFAAFGYIPPATGAILQEVIDASVILNALRAAW